jgi:hypothetical protein
MVAGALSKQTVVSSLSNTSDVEYSDSLRAGSPSIGIGGSLSPAHRVAGGGHPPPAPTERSVQIFPHYALQRLIYSAAIDCSSR